MARHEASTAGQSPTAEEGLLFCSGGVGSIVSKAGPLSVDHLDSKKNKIECFLTFSSVGVIVQGSSVSVRRRYAHGHSAPPLILKEVFFKDCGKRGRGRL